jgi:hypothetical protein
MVYVLLGRDLLHDLGVEASLELAEEFQQYKLGMVSFGGTFGRDKPFSWPQEVVEQELWHVHLEEDAVVKTWDYLSENYQNRGFTQDNYTSDKILVYGQAWDVRYSPYILIAILNPNGHAKMEDIEVLAVLAEQYVEEKDHFSADPEGNHPLMCPPKNL